VGLGIDAGLANLFAHHLLTEFGHVISPWVQTIRAGS
jgi:hypothetical protein